MSDFTGEELAFLLEQDQRKKMRLHRLTITEVLDRKGLAVSLRRDLFTTLSITEVLRIVDNLPFVESEMWTEPSHVEKVLSPYCKFTYEQIPFPGNENASVPPWESPEYISAKNWYNTLPEEDRKRIDILVMANMPWA